MSKPKKRKKRGEKKSSRRSWWRRLAPVAFAAALLACAAGIWLLIIVQRMGADAIVALESPTRRASVDVLAAPRVLQTDDEFTPELLIDELRATGYRRVDDDVDAPGEFRLDGAVLDVYRRAHVGPWGFVPSARARVEFRGKSIRRIRSADGSALRALTLEPQRLGSFRGPELADQQPLSLDQFPPRLVDAVLAAEDERYLTHRGVDLKAIARAAWSDISTRGGTLQGGSTITQQVIKNRVVGHERTLSRKLREASIALYVERKLSKKRILEIYLNEIYLGQRGSVSVIGFPAAAYHYFGKDVRDLELSEMATLAGLIASPGRWDPRRHPARSKSRRDWVLERMTIAGFIDGTTRDIAMQAVIETAEQAVELDPAGDVMDAVERELSERGFPPNPSDVPVRVFTAIDPLIQRAARQSLNANLERLEKEQPTRAPLEGAVIAMRPNSGEIVAMVGGRTGERGGFHRALDAKRQPGSAFKPFVALAAFLEGRWYPAEIVDDEPLEVELAGRTWRPRNIDGQFRGPVTVRYAIERSLNVPIARMGMDVGAERIAHWARLAGVDGRYPTTPSVSLGTGEVTPLSLATGYATIATLGVRHDSHLVRNARIVSSAEGEDAPLQPTETATRVLPQPESYLVLDMLAGAIQRGTGRRLNASLGRRLAAGKTGTTQKGKDAWFVFLNQELVIVVWVGRDDSQGIGLQGSRSALPVVESMLTSVGPLIGGSMPQAPPEIVLANIDPELVCLARRPGQGGVREVFVEWNLPPECESTDGFWRRLWDFRRDESDRETEDGRRKKSDRRRRRAGRS